MLYEHNFSYHYNTKICTDKLYTISIVYKQLNTVIALVYSI